MLNAAGEAWAAKAGGTSGVLWGAALAAAADRLGDKETPGDRHVAAAVRAGHDALVSLGGASRGDKTMLDALGPFVESLETAIGDGTDWCTAWLESVEVAEKAAAETQNSVRRWVGPARSPSAASAPPTPVPYPWRCARTSSAN